MVTSTSSQQVLDEILSRIEPQGLKLAKALKGSGIRNFWGFEVSCSRIIGQSSDQILVVVRKRKPLKKNIKVLTRIIRIPDLDNLGDVPLARILQLIINDQVL